MCQVARSGDAPGDQWPGIRVVSAQKANTANALSLPQFALSTANLYAPVRPGASPFGLRESNPVDLSVGYRGDFGTFGRHNDPMRAAAASAV